MLRSLRVGVVKGGPGANRQHPQSYRPDPYGPRNRFLPGDIHSTDGDSPDRLVPHPAGELGEGHRPHLMRLLHEDPGQTGYAQHIARGAQNNPVRRQELLKQLLRIVFALVPFRKWGIRWMLPTETLHAPGARRKLVFPKVNEVRIYVAQRL